MKCSFDSKKTAKNTWGLLQVYFQIKTNQTERNMKFRKMFYEGWKGRRHQTTTLAKMYNKIAHIELPLLVMFVFVSCFPLASVNMSQNKSTLTVWSQLWEDGVAFSFWIPKFRTKTQFYRYADTLHVENLCENRSVSETARRFYQNGACESCQLRQDLVLSKIPYQ
jgi:hypothetical protein